MSMIAPEIEAVIAAAGGAAAFQSAQGLTADGVAGPRTYNAALRVHLGLAPLRIPSAAPGKDGVSRPDLDACYGKFGYTHLPPDKIKDKKDSGRIVRDAGWESAKLVNKRLWDGQSLKLHRDIADEFDWLFKLASKASGYQPVYLVGDKPRHTLWNPAKSLSTHSWGIAADFDCARNDLGGVDAEKGGPSLMRKHPEFPAVFKAYGWAWGGDWSIKDDMHVQRGSV